MSLASQSPTPSLKPKIVVVGAGLGGMTTAYRLHKHNCDVELYEAKGRIGGRVFSVKLGDTIAELGGKSILDGGDAQHLFRLIGELGLELSSHDVTLKLSFFSQGKKTPPDQLWKESHFEPQQLQTKLENLAESSPNMYEVLKGLFTPEDPRFRILATRLKAYEGGDLKDLSPLYISTLYHLILGGLSSAYPFQQQETGGYQRVSIAGGNALLVEKMGQTLKERLHLNAPLLKVEKTTDHRFVLTFKNKGKVTADILVLAIPCTVYSDITFGPDVLPKERLEAIQNVQYGHNSKILMEAPQLTSPRMGICNDRAVCYCDYKILNLYYAHEGGRFSKETIQDHFTQDLAMVKSQFSDLFKEALQVAYAEDKNFLSYPQAVGYSWPDDLYIKGCYSYIAVGQEALLQAVQKESGEFVKTLFAPLDRKLYFAGEHASMIAEGTGTMEAACESGERTARLILKNLFQVPFN